MAHCDVTDAAVLGCLLCCTQNMMQSDVIRTIRRWSPWRPSSVRSRFVFRRSSWWKLMTERNPTRWRSSPTTTSGTQTKKTWDIDRYSCFKNKYLLFWWSSAFIPESCDLCVTCSCQASSQTHLEPGDGHEESRERQAVELHPRAAETAAAEEGRQPRGAGSGRLHVFYRYPLNCRLVDHQADSELMLCSD